MFFKKSIARITSISGKRHFSFKGTYEEYLKEKERLIPRPKVSSRF